MGDKNQFDDLGIIKEEVEYGVNGNGDVKINIKEKVETSPHHTGKPVVPCLSCNWGGPIMEEMLHFADAVNKRLQVLENYEVKDNLKDELAILENTVSSNYRSILEIREYITEMKEDLVKRYFVEKRRHMLAHEGINHEISDLYDITDRTQNQVDKLYTK